jgi:hypothetical protein
MSAMSEAAFGLDRPFPMFPAAASGKGECCALALAETLRNVVNYRGMKRIWTRLMPFPATRKDAPWLAVDQSSGSTLTIEAP